MRHFRIAGSVEAANLILQQTVGFGHTLMLTQMFHPAFDEKGLDHASRMGCIFEHAPSIGAVAAPLVLELRQRFEEWFSIARIDAVFHGDQHWAAIVFDRLHSQRRRPMH